MHCMSVYKPLVYRKYYFYDINSGNLISSASNTVALWMFTKSAFEITFCYFGKKKHIFWQHYTAWCFDQPGRCPWPWQESWNEMIFTVPSNSKYSIMILGLQIINLGPCLPKWTVVAHDNWEWDLTTQKISLCCAFGGFLWHLFSQLQHVFPSVFFVLIKPLDPVKAGRFSSIKCKYFPFSTSC